VGARLLRDGDIVRVGTPGCVVVDPEERYLRQMEQCDARPTPAAASFVHGCRQGQSPRPAAYLPLVATAIAVTALLLALGLVLALAFAA
jgi:hypothetical protein